MTVSGKARELWYWKQPQRRGNLISLLILSSGEIWVSPTCLTKITTLECLLNFHVIIFMTASQSHPFQVTQAPHQSLAPQRDPVLPSPLHTGAELLILITHKLILRLREVSGVVEATWVQVFSFFTVADTEQCKEWLGQFSEDLGRFANGFQNLTLTFDLAQWNLQFILATYSIPGE